MATVEDATINQLLEKMSTLVGSVQESTQTAKQINQSISDLLTKASSATATTRTATDIEQAETFAAERFQTETVDRSGEVFKAWQKIFQEVATQTTKELAEINKVTIEHLQNATTTVHQANTNYNTHVANNNAATVKHGDIATNAQWNLEPSEGAAQTTVLRAVSLDDAALKAIGAMVAAAVADAVKPKA